MKTRQSQRERRNKRIRSRVQGTADRPRLTVFRSNAAFYVQLIDDAKRITLFGVRGSGKNVTAAKALGTVVAEQAKGQHITAVVFDRSGYQYHGSIKAFADAVREGGITL